MAKLVERHRRTRKEFDTWTEHQVGRFLEHVSPDRLSAAFQLSMFGLRRGEVLGLRWTDIDFDAKTLTIRLSRADVGRKVVEGEPKTERGKRTLPLDDSLVASLRGPEGHSGAQERLAAGEAYSAGCGDCGGAHIVVDELGRPVRPEWYSKRFQRISRQAGLPAIRLHDARHTSATIIILRGVPVTVVSKWHGDATAAFTLAHYAHSQDEALQAAGAMFAAAIRGQ